MLPEINLQSDRPVQLKSAENPSSGGLAHGSHGVDFASVLGRRVDTDVEGVVSLEGKALPERGKPLPPQQQLDEIGEGAPPFVTASPVDATAVARRASRREAAGDLTEAMTGSTGMVAVTNQPVPDAPEAVAGADDTLAQTQLSTRPGPNGPGGASNSLHTPLVEVPAAPASAGDTPDLPAPVAEPESMPAMDPLAQAISAAIVAPPGAPGTNRADADPDLRQVAVNSQLQRPENLATGPDATQPAVRPQISTAQGASPATLQDMPTSDTNADAEFEVSEEGLTALRPHASLASSAQQGLETTGMAAQMARSAPSVATGAASTTLATSLNASIAVPVQDSGWDTAVAERVLLMANNKLQNAELRLSPADLGPLRVELRIEDTTANVNFHTSQAVTRDALEQAMPKLREMLADSGLQLGRCDVSDSGLGDRAEERQAHETHSSHGLGDAAGESAGDSAGEAHIRSAVGLVDTFA